MPFLFENLDVYKLAMGFHRKIIKFFVDRRFEGYSYLADQLKRASLSILHIPEQEDHGFRSKKIIDSGPRRSLIPIQEDH